MVRCKIRINGDQVKKLITQALSMYENYIAEEQGKNFDKHFEDLEIEGEILR